jgi:hypothetical protein
MARTKTKDLVIFSNTVYVQRFAALRYTVEIQTMLRMENAFVSESPSTFLGRALLTGFARRNDMMLSILDSAEKFLGVPKCSLYRYLDELNWVQRDPDQIGHDEISHYFGGQLLFETTRLYNTFQFRVPRSADWTPSSAPTRLQRIRWPASD